ncbi:MAG: hypothetical protein HYX88_04175 [Chloroflexi bacterium]|nr:hypothetical protein [Chloroflexota bacterium]
MLRILVTTLILVAAACGTMARGRGEEATPPVPTPVPAGAEVAVELAKKDLASKKNISDSGIAVVTVEEKDWADTSLGLPKPGTMYAQVITPGYRIILSHGGESYEYHSDRGQRVVLKDSSLD